MNRVEVLKVFHDFANGKPYLSKIKIGENGTAMADESYRSLFFDAKDDWFKEEFGLSDLGNFLSIVSTLGKDIQLEYELPYIFIKNDHVVVKYKTANEMIFEETEEKIQKARRLVEISEKMIEDGKKYIEIKIEKTIVDKIKKLASNVFGKRDCHLKFKYEKDLGMIVEEYDNRSENRIVIELGKPLNYEDIKDKIDSFECIIGSDALISMDWVMYFFDETVEIEGEEMEVIWTYLKGVNEDGDNGFKEIIVFFDDDE